MKKLIIALVAVFAFAVLSTNAQTTSNTDKNSTTTNVKKEEKKGGACCQHSNSTSTSNSKSCNGNVSNVSVNDKKMESKKSCCEGKKSCDGKKMEAMNEEKKEEVAPKK